MPTRQERIAGGLLGLLVGDALGVPYEFNPPERLPPRSAIEYETPRTFQRSHPRVPPGTWSDDGAQALCLLDSLLSCDRMDANDFAQRLVRWYQRGYLAVDADVFDVGIQTSEVLNSIGAGVPALQATRRDEMGNGNGALMRALPLALWHRGTDAELVRDARLSSEVTHGHVRSQLCCAVYCLWARKLLEGGGEEAWQSALDALPNLLPSDDHDAHRELKSVLTRELAAEGGGSGYVVDSLRSARDVMHSAATYEDVVRSAILLGRDTDTTACIAGGVAGVRSGKEGIPERWRAALRGKELYEPLLARLLAR